MTYLADLGMTPEVIEDYLDRRLIRRQFSPDGDKVIYNYTESCMTGRVWDPITLQCRGLIAVVETGLVIARPFRKFFNYGEESGGKSRYAKSAPVVVTDKIDGSLGILYPDGDGSGFSVATRGSFTSEQALHATWIWKAGYEDHFRPPVNKTLLFEIVYPENRIVVDYKGRDDLILLGMVDIETGISYGPQAVEGWPGLTTEVFSYPTFRDALAAEPRPNAEGLVVHFPDTDRRVKLKQEDYIALHKIVTGLNEQVVWESLVEDTVDEVRGALPDELWPWFDGVANRLEDEFVGRYSQVLALDNEATQNDDLITRKDFALWYKDWAEPWMLPALFHLLDNKPTRLDDAERVVWNTIKPSKEK